MDYEETKRTIEWRYDFDPMFHALVEEGVRFALAGGVNTHGSYAEDVAEATRWGIGAALLMEEVQNAATPQPPPERRSLPEYMRPRAKDEDEQEPPPKGALPISPAWDGFRFLRRLRRTR